MKNFFLSKQKITEKHVAKIRHDWGLSDAKRDETKKTPENIQRFDNILYGEDKTWQILDVYKPKSAEVKLPVIVNVHGGGWVYGTKEKPLWHVFHVDCDMKEAQECNKTQMEFFKSFLQKD